MKNLGLKCLALIISILIWWFVNSESNIAVKTITVPVDFKDKPTEKIIVSDLNRQVKVTLRGPGFLVSKVEASQPVFKVQIPQTAGEKFTATFSKYDLPITPPLEVVEIDPPSMEVVLQKSITKELEVNVPKVGTVNENLKVDSIQVTPERITATGVDFELSNLQRIDTEPLDLREFGLDNASKPILRKLKLKIPGKFTSVSSGDTVDVQVLVSAIEIERTFSGVLIELRSTSSEFFNIHPNKVTVEVAGLKKDIESLSKEEIYPFVRLVPGVKGDAMVKILVDLPRGISLSRVDPPQVTIIPKEPEPKPQAIKKKGH